jgi:septal ring factor EnvC (AmiA/AmiB activator)
MKIADLDLDKEERKRSAPKDRIPMIKEVFELVLNREPSSRELSFYKYGVQEREEIIEKLLEDDEHKEALEKSKELPELEDRVKDAEHKSLQLKQRLQDQQEEIDQIRNLLDEKNKEIAILRREKDDPYNFTHSEALKYIKQLTENRRTDINTSTQQSSSDEHFRTVSSSDTQGKKTFLDKVYDFIRPK